MEKIVIFRMTLPAMKPLSLIILLLFSLNSGAQVPFHNRADTTTQIPLSYSHHYDYAKLRIHKFNLNVNSAVFDTLSLFIDSVGTAYDSVVFTARIYIYEDTDSTHEPELLSNIIPVSTLVYDDTIAIHSQMDSTWLHIPFIMPYNYQGQNLNIILESVNSLLQVIDSNQISFRSNKQYINSWQVWSSNSAVPVDSGLIIDYSPNYKLNIQSMDSCKPVISSPLLSYYPQLPTQFDSVHFGFTFPPLGVGYTYTWQTGMCNFTWNNIPGIYTVPYLTIPSPGQPFCMWAIITCNGQSTTSMQANVPVIYITSSKDEVNPIINLVPNPAYVNFAVQSAEEIPLKLHIYNAEGRFQKEVLCKGGQQLIEISEMPDGVYIIRIFADNRIAFARLIKL
jgi:hypothetical protein